MRISITGDTSYTVPKVSNNSGKGTRGPGGVCGSKTKKKICVFAHNNEGKPDKKKSELLEAYGK